MGYKDDYIAHHEPFQYYASTANPHHLTAAAERTTPRRPATIGTDTQSTSDGAPQFNTANHNYDTSDFDQLVAAITAGQLPASALPAVTFLKAPGTRTATPPTRTRRRAGVRRARDQRARGHARLVEHGGDRQLRRLRRLVRPRLQRRHQSVAVPGGQPDEHRQGVIGATNPTSQQCGPSLRPPSRSTASRAVAVSARACRLLVSPCSKQNAVDHNLERPGSIINFVEYNWHLPAIKGSFDQALQATDAKEGIPFDLAGLFDFESCSAPPLILDPATGRIDVRSTSEHGRNLKGVDWAGVEAAGVDLGGSNLQSAFVEDGDLSGADLQGSNLNGADLRNVDLTGAALRGANLSHADLTGAKLGHAVLTGANLNGDDLTNADLSGAVTMGANVSQVTWSNTVCPDGTNSNADGGTCKGRL